MPYRGGALAINDTISGQVEAVFAVMPEAVPHVQSGRLRALGVMSPKRSPVMPQVPTMAEAGTADLNLSAWTALLAPAKTPSAITDQLKRAVAAVFDTELGAKLAEAGIEVATSTPGGIAATDCARHQVARRIGEGSGLRAALTVRASSVVAFSHAAKPRNRAKAGLQAGWCMRSPRQKVIRAQRCAVRVRLFFVAELIRPS